MAFLALTLVRLLLLLLILLGTSNFSGAKREAQLPSGHIM